MYGSNGTGSVLAASATVVSSTTAAIVLPNTGASRLIYLIAITSYVLLGLTLLSFFLKKTAKPKISQSV